MEIKVLSVLLVVLSAVIVYSLIGVPTSYVSVGNSKFFVDLADSLGERQRGLMFVDNLCDDCGMLFVFDSEDKWDFWMKNMLIPLDIVFISADKKVVGIHHVDPCIEEPCELYSSDEPAKFVLEVNKNSFDDSVIDKTVEIVV